MPVPAGPSTTAAVLFELDQLAALMQQDLDTATAELARTMATGRLRAATRQRLLLVEDDTVELHAGQEWLELPERPVVSVAEVAGYATDAWELKGGRIRLTGAAAWPEFVTVTYTHGYASDEVPDDLREVALNVATRIMLNPADHRQEASGGYSASYAARLNGDEKQLLRQYRRKTLCYPTA